MMRISCFVTFAFVLGPTLVACGGEDFQDSGLGEVPGTEETSSESQPIWGPTARGRAAIWLNRGRCSGVLLNNRTFLTSAHCADASPATEDIKYQGPTGDMSWTRIVDFTKHPNYNGAPEWDIAIGTFGVPLNGITADDYATIRRDGGLGGGRQVEQAGYGGTLSGGSLGVQRRINLKVTWNGPHHAKWETVVSAGQMACSGDSGGPGFRHSGYTDSSGGRKWDVVAWLMMGGISIGSAPVGCDDEGRATYIYDKVDWIRGIVQAVTPYTCTNFTTPSGEPAAWCWAT